MTLNLYRLKVNVPFFSPPVTFSPINSQLFHLSADCAAPCVSEQRAETNVDAHATFHLATLLTDQSGVSKRVLLSTAGVSSQQHVGNMQTWEVTYEYFVTVIKFILLGYYFTIVFLINTLMAKISFTFYLRTFQKLFFLSYTWIKELNQSFAQVPNVNTSTTSVNMICRLQSHCSGTISCVYRPEEELSITFLSARCSDEVAIL